jgi:hypothetical protein
MEDERDFYGDNPTPVREVIGYCGYDHSEIFEDDEYVEYKGQLYHKANFLQMNLGLDTPGINDE